MREISAGIFNLLKSTKRPATSVGNLVAQLDKGDDCLEANLCKMFQSVRGTKQYWFLRQSELKCMIREWGSPTFFITLSCAEYDSPDITEFLHRVNNNMSSSYDIGRLCTEDPVSVSREFSLKFHAFFNTVLVKNAILGTVEHYFWKKEYQARGAPHYHMLLWIRDAPIIGIDNSEKVLGWLEQHITCAIPKQDTNPELQTQV